MLSKYKVKFLCFDISVKELVLSSASHSIRNASISVRVHSLRLIAQFRYELRMGYGSILKQNWSRTKASGFIRTNSMLNCWIFWTDLVCCRAVKKAWSSWINGLVTIWFEGLLTEVLKNRYFPSSCLLAPALFGKVWVPLSRVTEFHLENAQKSNLDVFSVVAELAWGSCVSRLRFGFHHSQILLFTL